MNTIEHPFSDLISGYVTAFDNSANTFVLKTADNQAFEITLTDTTGIELLRNLDEPFQSMDAPLVDLLLPGRFLMAYGILYPEKKSFTFEAKRIIFVGREINEYRFDEPYWWVNQIRSLADFYFHAQFPDGEIDYRHYRTHLTLEGVKIEGTRQETDTMSRMIYGFATAYLLTGVDHYLDAAQKGTAYLREHMRAVDEDAQIVYWYHAMDLENGKTRKIFSSQFNEDTDSLPAYEQIYALVGPVQTYRVTGDPQILKDAEGTVNLFNKFFLDQEKEGYYSHIDPVSFSPLSNELGQDRDRKNWNSIGDHIPAYLINLWLATGDERYAEMMVNLANMIEQHFPDYAYSPFVQERFHGDWSRNQDWNWQQDRAVVGHNLKIAWNLMRVHHFRPNQKYLLLAQKIAGIMPPIGMDQQRGGWYDVMERIRKDGDEWHRLVWHDRKAWWQQEQAILAYLILAGSLKVDEHNRLAHETASFYNAFFLDHDSGGVYFNVLATGIPYLVGTERLKGSHSMSGYHSFELCYLSAVYSNLLINKQPMDFHFKTHAGLFKDDILHVQPDLLPPGSVHLQEVWINEEPYSDFDPLAMTVKLPVGFDELKVRARVAPSGTVFDLQVERMDDLIHITLWGILNETNTYAFKEQLDDIMQEHPRRIVLHMEKLQSMSVEAARVLSFAVEKLSLDKNMNVTGAHPTVQDILTSVGVWEEMATTETVLPETVA